jgi:hypothetical protein
MSEQSAFSNQTRRDLRPVVDDSLHSFARCALCGSATTDLYVTTLVWTHARGALCADASACCRRWEISRRAV